MIQNKYKLNEVITTRQAAEILGVCPKTLSNWAEEGKVSCWKTLGGHRRFSISVVHNFRMKLINNQIGNESYNTNIICDEISSIIVIGTLSNIKEPILMNNVNITYIKDFFSGLIQLSKNNYNVIIFIIDDLVLDNIGYIIEAINNKIDLNNSNLIFISSAKLISLIKLLTS